MNNDNSCLDGLIVENSELAYDSISANKIYKSQFLQDCTSCSNSYFLYDCIGCSDCMFCYNLRNQKYCFENKQLTEKEYTAIQDKIFKLKKTYSGLKALKNRFQEIINKNAIHKALRQISCEDCSGDYLSDSKNAVNSFMCSNLEDCSNLFLVNDAKDVVDGNNSIGAELCYECCTSGVGGYQVLFSIDAWPQHNEVYYSYFSPNSKSLFGCSGLKRGKYSILNREYSKQDYEETVAKIIKKMIQSGEWGEFFTPDISPFAYNETCAHEWFPMSESTAVKYGFSWSHYEAPFAISENAIKAGDLPDSIDDVKDNILSSVILCERSDRPFRLTKFEVGWYRSEGLPIPRLHPDERHKDRIDKILPRSIKQVSCASCKETISSTFTANQNKVFCQACYEKQI